MTEKEFHRLKRREVLQLFLVQSEELEATREELRKVTEERDQLSETYERLRKRLDQKDAHIHGLRELLEAERKKRRIELEEAGNIAEAALRLNGIFAAAQKAADQYLYNIELLAASGGKIPEEELSPEERKLLEEEEREAEADRTEPEAGESSDADAEPEEPSQEFPMDDWNRDIDPLSDRTEAVPQEEPDAAQ